MELSKKIFGRLNTAFESINFEVRVCVGVCAQQLTSSLFVFLKDFGSCKGCCEMKMEEVKRLAATGDRTQNTWLEELLCVG